MYVAHRDLHSFPTRRSSDLAVGEDEQSRDAHDVVATGQIGVVVHVQLGDGDLALLLDGDLLEDRGDELARPAPLGPEDRKSTRLNSSHLGISYAVFCLKKKK